MSKRITNHKDFIKAITKLHPTIQILGRYVKSKEPILVKCINCGYEWSQIADSLLKNRGRSCDNCPRTKVYKRSHEDFIKIMHDKHPTIKVLGKYTKSNDPIEAKCLDPKCNYTWVTTPPNLLQNLGCPKCSNRIPLTQEEFEYLVNSHNRNIQILGKYTSRRNRIKVKCLACNRVWQPVAGSVSSGSGCSCSRHLDQEEFESRVHSKLPNIKVLGNYINNTQRIKVKCLQPNCGKIWKPEARYLLDGKGCPFCNPRNSKIGIMFLLELSEKYNWSIQHFENGKEHRLEDGNGKYVFPDGWIPNLGKKGLAIDFLGNYWHGYNRETDWDNRIYYKTLERFNWMLELNCCILYIWELDYKIGKNPILLLPYKDKKLLKWAKENNIDYIIAPHGMDTI